MSLNRYTRLYGPEGQLLTAVAIERSENVLNELTAILQGWTPPGFTLKVVREQGRGDLLLTGYLIPNNSEPNLPEATTEPVIHTEPGKLLTRTARLFGPDGQLLDEVTDTGSSVNVTTLEAWARRKLASTLANYSAYTQTFKPKINGCATLDIFLSVLETTAQRPRNVVIERHTRRKIVPGERSPHVVKHQGESKVEATPRRVVRIDHTTALRARRTDYQTQATTRKSQPRNPPAAKARQVYVAPQSRQRNAAAPATFEWQVVFLILDVVRDKDGKKDKREIPNLGFVLAGGVTTPNTSQEKLKSAVKPLLLEHGLRSNRVLAYHPVPGQNPLLLVLLPPTDRPKINPAEILDVLDAKRAMPSLPLRDNDELYRFAIEVMYREEMLTRPSQPITYTSGATPPGNNLLRWQVLFCICGAKEGTPLSFHIADEATTVNNRKESLKAGASLQLQALGIAPQNVLAYRGINGLLLVFIRAKDAKNLHTKSWNETTADFPALASQHAALQQLADQNVAQATPAIHWQVVFCLCQQGKPPMFTIAQQATTAVANRASYRDAAGPSLQARGLSLADVLAYHPVRGEQNLLLVMLSAHQGNNWQRLTQATASRRLPVLDNVRPEDLKRTLAKALERQGQTPPPVTAQSATL